MKNKKDDIASNYEAEMLEKYDLNELEGHYRNFFKCEGDTRLDNKTRQAMIDLLLHPKITKTIFEVLKIKPNQQVYKTTGSKIIGGSDLTMEDPAYQHILQLILKGASKTQIIESAAEEVIINQNGKYKEVTRYFGGSKRTFESTYAKNEENIKTTARTIKQFQTLSTDQNK